MLKSILWKEFRELMPLIMVIAAVEGCLLWSVGQGRSPTDHSVIDVELSCEVLIVIGLIFPLIIGLWHGARETQQNTFGFLLHRPVNRNWIFTTKLLFGGGICLLLFGLPLGLISYWADTKTSHYMLQFSKAECIGMPLLYLGAFLSMSRPARTIGSQFFPLLGAIFLFVVVVITYDSPIAWHPIALTILLAILFEAGFIVAILYVGNTRDYA